MWDQRYNTEEYVYGKNPNDFLVHCLAGIPPGKVLCLGEGEGRNAVYLARQGFTVTAVDASTVGMRKAQKLAHESGVTLTTIVADINSFEIAAEEWDVIISFFFHLPQGERHTLHRKVVKGLKPDGVFILEAFTPQQLKFGTGGPKTVDLLMRLEDLQTELAGLEFNVAREIERLIEEGDLHSGMSAVVQVLAQKSCTMNFKPEIP